MILDWLHLLLLALALAAGAAAFIFAQRRPPDTGQLTAELAIRASEITGLRSELADLRQRAQAAERDLAAQTARLAEREAGMAREREQLARLQQESEDRFKALADAALLRSQQHFVTIADETLKKHKEGAEGELGKMLKPIQETFGQFQKKVDEIQKVSTEDRARLEEQIRGVSDSVQKTQAAAGKLASALSTTRHGGRWGEETLRNVLEMAGLSPYADFTEQTSTDTEKGRLRPDVVVRMPGGRELVIDAKVSLDDYLAASGEADPARREAYLAAHAQKVRAHVSALARKDYWKNVSERVDFVAMFMPGENFYAAVLEYDREIFDYAAKNAVIIVTPSTLIALAKAVAYGWRQEQAARNTEEALALGRELYNRLSVMTEHMSKVGANLDKAVDSYNALVGSYERKVMPQVRRFEDLQIPSDDRSLEAPPALAVRARSPEPQQAKPPPDAPLLAGLETKAGRPRGS